MTILSNTPTIRYITVQGMVISDGGVNYPISHFETCDKYVYWDKTAPFTLQSSNELKQKEELYLIALNKNGTHTMVNQTNISIGFSQNIGGVGVATPDISGIVERVDKNTLKIASVSKDVDGVNVTVGKITDDLTETNNKISKLTQTSDKVSAEVSNINKKYNTDKELVDLKDNVTKQMIESQSLLSELTSTIKEVSKDNSLTVSEKTKITDVENKMNDTSDKLIVYVDSIMNVLNEQGLTEERAKLSTSKDSFKTSYDNTISIINTILSGNSISPIQITTILNSVAVLSTELTGLKDCCDDIIYLGSGGTIYEELSKISITSDKIAMTVSSVEERLDNTNETVDETVKNVISQFYLSDSETQLIGGSWVNSVPKWTANKYMWQRLYYEYTGLPSKTGTPVCIQGAKGQDGLDGANGIDGKDGTSISWRGTYSKHPSNPQNGWSYYNTTDKKSYVFQSGTWYQMSVDGADGIDGNNGVDGLSIEFKGELKDPPANPNKNWTYKDIDNGIVYIYTGIAWEVLTYDGSDGVDGADGMNGLSVFITYHDSLTQPSVPTGNGTTNGWHTNCTTNSVWISQKVSDGSNSGTWGAPVKIKGMDGSNGQDVISVTPQFQKHTNSITPPTGTWLDVCPSYVAGYYLWIRNKVVYANPSETKYTNAYYDASWDAKNTAENTDKLVTKKISDFQQTMDGFEFTVKDTVAKVDGIQVGGRNLVINSAFLQGKNNWNLGTNVIIDTNKTLDGNPSFKTSQSGLTSDGWRGAINYNLPQNPTTFKKDEEITYSCWYFVEDKTKLDNGLTLELKGKLDDSTSETGITSVNISSANVVQGEWTKIEKTYTFTGTYNNCCIRSFVRRNGTVWFTNFKLERGNKSTDWTPAPEDTKDFVLSQGYQTESQVQQTVDKFEIKFKESGGYNLLRNSSAKGGTEHWLNSGCTIFETYTSSSTLEQTSCGKGFRLGNDKTSEKYVYSHRFLMQKGKTYTVSGKYYVGSGSKGIDVYLLTSNTLNTEGDISLSSYDNSYVCVSSSSYTGEWVAFSNVVTITDTTLSGVIRLDNNGTAVEGENKYVYFADLLVSEGQLDMPWTPNPNEVYDGITTIDKTGITVTSSNVKSKTSMSSNGFRITKTDTNEDVFKVNSDGTLALKGSMTITDGSISDSALSSNIKNGASAGTSAKGILDTKASGWDSTKTTVDSNSSKWNTTSTDVSNGKTNWGNAFNRVNEWCYGAVTGSTNINGGKIQTNTILADKIAVGDFTNYVSDPNFENNIYTNSGAFSIVTNQKHSGTKSLKMSAGANNNVNFSLSRKFSVRNGDKIYVEWWGYRDSANQNANINLTIYNGDGTVKDYDISGNISMSSTCQNAKWIKYSYMGSPNIDGYAIVNAKLRTSNTLTGNWYFDDVLVKKMTTGELIVDGTITSKMIHADGISGDKLKINGATTLGSSDGDRILINNADYEIINGTKTKGFFGLRQLDDSRQTCRLAMSHSGLDKTSNNYFVATTYPQNDNPMNISDSYMDMGYRCQRFKQQDSNGDISNIRMLGDGDIMLSPIRNLVIKTNYVSGAYPQNTSEKQIARFCSSSSQFYDGHLEIDAIRRLGGGTGLILAHYNDNNQGCIVRVGIDSAGFRAFRPVTQDGNISVGSASYPFEKVTTKTGVYTSEGIVVSDNPVVMPVSSVADNNIIDNINFIEPITRQDTGLIMDVTNIKDTNYIEIGEGNEVYLKESEMIKLLVKEIKELKNEVKLLTNEINKSETK